jgi:hypothetical protein
MRLINKKQTQEIIDKVFEFKGLRFPKRMPGPSILKYISNPVDASMYLPSTDEKSGKQFPPRISFRKQQEIRSVCQLADIDPSSINLPPEKPLSEIAADLPESFFLPKGHQRELDKYKRYFELFLKIANARLMRIWRKWMNV